MFFPRSVVLSKWGKEVNLDRGENIGRGEEGEDREAKRRRILRANRPDYPIIIRGEC